MIKSREQVLITAINYTPVPYYCNFLIVVLSQIITAKLSLLLNGSLHIRPLTFITCLVGTAK